MKLKKMKLALTILIILIVFFSLNKLGIGQVRNSIYLISSPLQRMFFRAGQRVSENLGGLFQTENLKQENSRLREINYALLQKVIKLQEIAKENEQLREALELGLPEKFNLQLVKVISRQAEGDVILINEGEKNGIEPGMPVISSSRVLIGKVGKVLPNFSEVILISNLQSIFDIEISSFSETPEEILGVARGQGNSQLQFQFVPREFQIQAGDIVTTSRIGGNFPPALLVGKIQTVIKEDVEAYQHGRIEPFFTKEKLGTLFVIKNFISKPR